MIKELWIVVQPQSNHYDQKYIDNEIERLSSIYNVRVMKSKHTRERADGIERLYHVEGDEIDIDHFIEDLNIYLK